MDICSSVAALSAIPTGSTVAIGVFDGVHVGHQAVIRRAVLDAQTSGRRSVVFTFTEHPEELLAPQRAPRYLTTPMQREKLIAACGTDTFVCIPFNSEFARLSADEFYADILLAQLGARSIVVGDNFRFGAERAGDVKFLLERQGSSGCMVHALAPVIVSGVPASSTRIRQCIAEGLISKAEEVLGHEYWLVGEVVHGQRLARTLGYATANLDIVYRQVIPADGIYAVTARLADGRTVAGACAIGERPTVPGAGRAVEVHLLDFDESLYGQEISVRFIERLRDEVRFNDLDALKAQMSRDVAASRRILANFDGVSGRTPGE